jgi:hypothetical protein
LSFTSARLHTLEDTEGELLAAKEDTEGELLAAKKIAITMSAATGLPAHFTKHFFLEVCSSLVFEEGRIVDGV